MRRKVEEEEEGEGRGGAGGGGGGHLRYYTYAVPTRQIAVYTYVRGVDPQRENKRVPNHRPDAKSVAIVCGGEGRRGGGGGARGVGGARGGGRTVFRAAELDVEF